LRRLGIRLLGGLSFGDGELSPRVADLQIEVNEDIRRLQEEGKIVF